MWSPPPSVSPLWHFPPLFTLQPNQSTRAAQLREWQDIVCAFCAATRQEVISLDDCPVWENRELARRLPPEGTRAVADFMTRSGRAAPERGSATLLRVKWRDEKEWARLLFEYADRVGARGGDPVLVGELRRVEGADFCGLEAQTLVGALRELARQGRALVFDDADEDSVSVKFT
jgi:ESCRT-II complex subunit VPS25